jgi:ATP-dependent HslUV protease ATP-binding subunit HslU
VELKGLAEEDLYRILTEPVTNLIRQQVELMATEDVELIFTDAAIREIAKVSFEVNRTVENIGARRLHTGNLWSVQAEPNRFSPHSTGAHR